MSFKLEIIENQRAIEIIAKYMQKATDFITLCDGMDISRNQSRNLLCLNATERVKSAVFQWEEQKEHTTMEFINILKKFNFGELARELGFPLTQCGPCRPVKVKESIEFRMQLQLKIKKSTLLHTELLKNIEQLQNKKQSLLAEEDNLLCCVCMERQKNTALAPCGHLCVCFQCSSAVVIPKESLCPICRGAITSSLRVYV